VRALRTVPTTEGGTCALPDPVDCYDSFQTEIVIPDAMTTVSLPWSMFRQPGYTNPLPGYAFQRELMSVLIGASTGYQLDVVVDNVRLY
jgi:hypothetical protein